LMKEPARLNVAARPDSEPGAFSVIICAALQRLCAIRGILEYE